MPINFAFHPNLFLREIGSWSAENFAAACGRIFEMGWRGVEYAAGVAQKTWPDPQDYKRVVTDHGLRPLTLYTPYAVSDPAAVDAALERGRQSFAYLAEAGCEFALLDGGWKKRSTGRPDETSVLAECANRMAELANRAGLRGVWHQHYGTVIEHGPQFHRFMELVDPQLVEFCPDTAQLALGDINCEDTFRRYLERITYVHFKDLDAERRMREPGGGFIHFEPLRDMLLSKGYAGWVCPDLGRPTGMTVQEAARRCMDKLVELFGAPQDD